MTTLGKSRREENPGGGATTQQEAAAKQLPFHESIVAIIKNQRRLISANGFVLLCKLIESTKIPKGHDEVAKALKTLAISGGHQYMDEFLDAIRSLQLGAEEAVETATT